VESRRATAAWHGELTVWFRWGGSQDVVQPGQRKPSQTAVRPDATAGLTVHIADLSGTDLDAYRHHFVGAHTVIHLGFAGAMGTNGWWWRCCDSASARQALRRETAGTSCARQQSDRRIDCDATQLRRHGGPACREQVG
jgi:hypothetical protein